ncbi:RluA family pseudouridine synthase [Planctomycetota bacterium]|nr:RluA family pseudouridine synthase [Planctomycetota bacterium]
MAYRSFALIHEDPHLLVVSKPAGLLVNMSEGKEQTLEDQVRANVAKSTEPGACPPTTVHRLDRYTSGLVIFGRTKRALSEMGKLVAAGGIKKTYWVLVAGRPEPATGTIDAPIKKIKQELRRAEVSDDSVAQRAVTHYKITEELGDFTMLECVIETGRTHQLRVHFEYIGTPIGGDGIYGRRKKNGWLRHNGLDRQFIHARELSFTHPITGKETRLTAKLPKDLSRVLKTLRQ